MYNPNEMDNTQNEGLNIPQENKLEADAASTEQNAAEKAVAEEKNEPVQTAPEAVQGQEGHTKPASNEMPAGQPQALLLLFSGGVLCRFSPFG